VNPLEPPGVSPQVFDWIRRAAEIEAEKQRYIAAEQSRLLATATAKETARDGRFIAYDNGTVLDTKTSLMWAAKDNGTDINWQNAKTYCENYHGGGYSD
jgi:hypothetical protein